MNDNKMLRFRESFRGYNKDDVNQYIEQLYINFSRKEAEYQARISGLTMNAPAQSIDLSAKLAEAENEIDKLKKQLENAKQVPETVDADEKSKLYDTMSSQVGNILIVANSNAEKLVSDAKTEADGIRTEAYADAEKIKIEAKAQADVMLREFEVKIAEASNGCLYEYMGIMKEAENKLNELTESLRAGSDELLNTVSAKSKRLENDILGLCSGSAAQTINK